jgi:hypothetical protein
MSEVFHIAMVALVCGYILSLGGMVATAGLEMERSFIWSLRAFVAATAAGAVDASAFLIWKAVVG